MKELRFDEIKELLRIDHRNQDRRLDLSELDLSEFRLLSFREDSKEARTVKVQQRGYKSYVYNKLERLHLIETITIEDDTNHSEIKGKVRLTDFGSNLVDHFRMEYSK